MQQYVLAAGIPVMMITGAKAAEVLSLSDDLPLLYPISIPDLPEDRSFHTMNNNIICGGHSARARTSCIKLTRDWGASFTASALFCFTFCGMGQARISKEWSLKGP